MTLPKRIKEMLDNIEFDRIQWTEDIDIIPLSKGAILVDRSHPGTLYVDEDAVGSVEILFEPTQKGYKTVTCTLSAKHGKIDVIAREGGEVHQDGCSFKVKHERE